MIQTGYVLCKSKQQNINEVDIEEKKKTRKTVLNCLFHYINM